MKKRPKKLLVCKECQIYDYGASTRGRSLTGSRGIAYSKYSWGAAQASRVFFVNTIPVGLPTGIADSRDP